MNELKSGSKLPLTASAAIQPLATKRNDAWWVEPALVATGFTLFIVYATWRAFMGTGYEVDNVISPFYSPKIDIPGFPFSPAFLILWMPAGFRATCYYYRKAYYRAYFADPPGCGVGHFGGEKYCGESKFPLIMQNAHRYMLYLALLVIAFLWYDAITSLFLNGTLRVGIVSIVMFVNCFLLSAYTFGCHALRHLVGGRLDCFSCTSGAKTQYGMWKWVSKLNEHHMLWAWLSLFSVGLTDAYVWQIAAHHVIDPTLIGVDLPYKLVH